MGSEGLSGLISDISKRRVYYLVWLSMNRPELLKYVTPDSLTEIVAILNSGDWRAKAYATLVLGLMASRGIQLPEYVTAEVIRLLSDPSEYVRSGAAWVLGRVGGVNSSGNCRAIYNSLIQLLGDPSWIVRTAAVKSLGELNRGCNSLRKVIESKLYDVLIHDKNDIVRKVAYSMLRSYGG